jgi:hypothetical protein
MRNKKEPIAFKPTWPEGVKELEFYRVPCDDKGRNGQTWLQVMVAQDGDIHVSMQEWEDAPHGMPSQCPSIRIRTYGGGGCHSRTRQALLWLADAIRRDSEELNPK